MSSTETLREWGHHIGGAPRGSATKSWSPVLNPFNGETFALVASGDARDVDAAVEAAAAVAPQWAATPWATRAAMLRQLADAIEDDAEDLARLDVLDAGIPIRGMRRDVKNAVGYLRYYAGLASELKGHSLERASTSLDVTTREPFGVVGRIVPFNHPFQFAVAAMAAPVAAGNAVVLKPAEQTPLSALRLAELASDVFPAGVFNVVAGGAEVGAALAAHPAVPRIGFTGSVATGRAVLRAAAEHIKVVTLELGGKNPLIVCGDVAPSQAADIALVGLNLQRTAGQSCGSTSRVYVHESIRAPFVDELRERLEALTLGDPSDEQTDVGPLAYEAHCERVRGYIRAGLEDGARIATGGPDRPDGLPGGCFVAPTVFDDVRDEMRIAREEIFGPVVSVLGWSDEADVVARANALDLGLTANVATNDLSAALRLSRALEAGYVWVNGRGQRPLGAPFGGHKQSGLGEENTLEELLSYTRKKQISMSEV